MQADSPQNGNEGGGQLKEELDGGGHPLGVIPYTQQNDDAPAENESREQIQIVLRAEEKANGQSYSDGNTAQTRCGREVEVTPAGNIHGAQANSQDSHGEAE